MRRAKRSTQFPDKFRTKIDGLLFSGYIATRDTFIYSKHKYYQYSSHAVKFTDALALDLPFQEYPKPLEDSTCLLFYFFAKYLSWVTCKRDSLFKAREDTFAENI